MSRMIRFHTFGAADVLRCEEQGEPSPAAGELQIRVEAIGVSWYDVLWRQNLAPSRRACRQASAMKWPVW